MSNDLPTETCKVIYQLDDYRSGASILVASIRLFTFSHTPGHGVWGIAGEKKKQELFFFIR